MPKQIAFDGTEIDWEKAAKPRRAASRGEVVRQTQESNDKQIIGWMKLWNAPLTREELAGRLAKVTKLSDGTVDAAIKRMVRMGIVLEKPGSEMTHYVLHERAR